MSDTSVWITRLDPGPGERVAVKDLFDTAGVRTTYGSAVFAEHVPDTTATAVERLTGSGYAVAGKANLHEFAYGITTQNPHYGTAPNPRFPGRTAGGSTGGSAAAIVLGEAELGLGTDSGGSIRIPAACCELTGFKPSWGVVPMAGCFPLAPSFDHAGPLARDVGGCARAMGALAGIQPERGVEPSDLRIGLAWRNHADEDVAARFDTAAGALASAEAVDLPTAEGVFPAFQAEIAEIHRDLFAEHAEHYGANVATKIGLCLELGEERAAEGRSARDLLRERFEDALEGLDLVLAPTLPMAPPPADVDELAIRTRMTLLTFPLNALGWPALALPCGRTATGMPVSAQLFGRAGSDALVLGAGESLERALAGWL